MKMIAFTAILAMSSIDTCAREDGQPDPPVRELVPCHPDAGADDPLACPPPPDAGSDAGPADLRAMSTVTAT